MKSTERCEHCGGVGPCACVRVLRRFVEQMAAELQANASKGGRNGRSVFEQGWRDAPTRFLISEVLYHAAKLAYAVRQYEQGDGEPERVLEFAADTANMAMMVADAAGVLER